MAVLLKVAKRLYPRLDSSSKNKVTQMFPSVRKRHHSIFVAIQCCTISLPAQLSVPPLFTSAASQCLLAPTLRSRQRHGLRTPGSPPPEQKQTIQQPSSSLHPPKCSSSCSSKPPPPPPRARLGQPAGRSPHVCRPRRRPSCCTRCHHRSRSSTLGPASTCPRAQRGTSPCSARRPGPHGPCGRAEPTSLSRPAAESSAPGTVRVAWATRVTPRRRLRGRPPGCKRNLGSCSPLAPPPAGLQSALRKHALLSDVAHRP
jgi:hypothetical protein